MITNRCNPGSILTLNPCQIRFLDPGLPTVVDETWHTSVDTEQVQAWATEPPSFLIADPAPRNRLWESFKKMDRQIVSVGPFRSLSGKATEEAERRWGSLVYRAMLGI